MKKHKADGGRGNGTTLNWEAYFATAKAGDARALAELCELVVARSAKFARHEGLPKNYSPEDFAQDVVQRFLINWSDIRYLPGWLAAVCVHVQASIYREYQLKHCFPLERALEAEAGYLYRQRSFSSSDFEGMESSLHFDFLLKNLTKDQQDVFVLRLVDGLSYAEIARILNKSQVAVRSSFVRGKRCLRAIIDPKVGEGYSHGLDTRRA